MEVMSKESRLMVVDMLNGIIDQAKFIRNNLIYNNDISLIEVKTLQDMMNKLTSQVNNAILYD